MSTSRRAVAPGLPHLVRPPCLYRRLPRGFSIGVETFDAQPRLLRPDHGPWSGPRVTFGGLKIPASRFCSGREALETSRVGSDRVR